MQFDYEFCPRCAGRMVEQDAWGKVRPVCPSCGLVIFHNPKIVVGVIPLLDGRVALVRRAMNPRRGSWVFPGGYVDLGENVEDAARRETMEEAGLDVRLERLVGVYSRTGEETILVVYAGQVTGGTLTCSEESLEAAWFPAGALPPAEDLGFWSTIAALDEWKHSEHL